MRMSRIFNQTLREAPTDAEVTSHKLLVRAGRRDFFISTAGKTRSNQNREHYAAGD